MRLTEVAAKTLGDLTPHEGRDGQPMWCRDCRTVYPVKTWQDEGSCPYCYSSNVYLVKREQ